MHILILQETDWLTRGPHVQHHIFERLSKNSAIDITVLDYDIDKKMKGPSLYVRKHVYKNIDRAVHESKVEIIRTAHFQVPFFRRISSLISNFVQLLKIFKKKKPDVVIGFSMTNGLIGLLLAKLYKIPYIFYYIDILHELIPIKFIQGFARVVTRISFKFSDRVIIQSKYHELLAKNEGAPLNRLSNIPEGVSLENTIIDMNKLTALKNKLGISKDDFVIFFMGYLYDFAGLLEIIKYYNKSVQSGKYKLKFLILGDGGIYNQLIQLKKDLRADWVILVGRVPFFDITEYIGLSDLCLMSFKKNEITKEITPIKVLEYMAMKKPILSNSLPNVVHEFINKSEIIFAKNQDDLIKKIAELIPQQNELRKMGQKGYDLIKKRYTWTLIIHEFKKVLINTIRARRRK